ncbi:receptor tyrosine phosphatase type r2a [Planoprotostelium fungivorum]|uniref:protein-tyrosine-phosphatase n=1 Tax=Planoprotostelium fungivorum TaxID=1890364 RepID=A0A2P6N1G4_9EUKA|nr:receptor tyrosine phosphatase type r2a [Planoprotostelium fungivorum]
MSGTKKADYSAACREFEEVQATTCASYGQCSIGSETRHAHKNRYWDIIPRNDTRVLLEADDEDEDYINASYIDGEEKKREYIACQAPLDSTIYDFWSMVWQQMCPLIVMLTALKEGKTIKCTQYWPDDGTCAAYGPIKVHHRKTFNLNPFTLRTFTLQKYGEEDRELVQIQMDTWPDHGVPTCTKVIRELLWLMQRIRQRSQLPGPALIHCSAGVGRTGSLIACDIISQRLRQRKSVDVKRTVEGLRKQRPKMVMTADQYYLIHRLASELFPSPSQPSASCSSESTTPMTMEAQTSHTGELREPRAPSEVTVRPTDTRKTTQYLNGRFEEYATGVLYMHTKRMAKSSC